MQDNPTLNPKIKVVMQARYCYDEEFLNRVLSTLNVEEGKYPRLCNVQYLVNPSAEGNDNNFKMENNIIAIVNYFVKVFDHDED